MTRLIAAWPWGPLCDFGTALGATGCLRRAVVQEPRPKTWKRGLRWVRAASNDMTRSDAIEQAARALMDAVRLVEWCGWEWATDMPLCIECGEGHPDHPQGGGHDLGCRLGRALRLMTAALRVLNE